MGAKSANYSKTTIVYDTRTKNFTDGPKFSTKKCQCICAVFRSAMHGGRKVLLSGSKDGHSFDIWDFDASWSWERGMYINFA